MWTAAEWLALHEYRAIKPAAIAHAMGVGESAARNALARLVADGYLDERTEARTRMYRLFWSRRTSRARSF
jgi:DNA-binding transcriptional regulator PaaX